MWPIRVDLESLLILGPSNLTRRHSLLLIRPRPACHCSFLTEGHVLASAALMRLGSSGLCCPVFLLEEFGMNSYRMGLLQGPSSLAPGSLADELVWPLWLLSMRWSWGMS